MHDKLTEPARLHRRLRSRFAGRAAWAVEASGIATVSAGAWMAWEPLGLVIAGSYLVLLANSRQEVKSDGTREVER